MFRKHLLEESKAELTTKSGERHSWEREQHEQRLKEGGNMTHCGNWSMQRVGGGVEAEAAVGARSHGAQNAKTRNTDFIHRCWGATENFKLKEI